MTDSGSVPVVNLASWAEEHSGNELAVSCLPVRVSVWMSGRVTALTTPVGQDDTVLNLAQ